MSVCVVGLGYIGLPTSLMLAANAVPVVGVDVNPAIIASLRNKEVPFEEKGLQELFDKAVDKGITFVTDLPESDFYIIAVPTPYDQETKKIDAGYVVKAAQQVLAVCKPGAVLVVESTVAPGTMDKYVRPLLADNPKGVHLAHAPERIIPGNMVHELEYNSRTVGADDPAVAQRVCDVYASFCKGKLVTTDIRTAEMTKVVENTFRDINIAFANELAQIARQADMDVHEIIRIANMHPRVDILSPGPGVGGHCISVDPWFLVGDFPETANLIHQARKVNDGMPDYVLSRIDQVMAAAGITDPARVGLFGLTYKEDVDDTRESPTLQLLERDHPVAKNAVFFDPWVKKPISDRQIADFDAFLAQTDMVVILVGHTFIRERFAALAGKTILDTRRVFNEPSVHTL